MLYKSVRCYNISRNIAYQPATVISLICEGHCELVKKQIFHLKCVIGRWQPLIDLFVDDGMRTKSLMMIPESRDTELFNIFMVD